MLRTLYRAMVISRAKSAAYQTLAILSDRELADIGYSRASSPENPGEKASNSINN